MNIILEHQLTKNTKLNKIARIGYFLTATFDPFGLTSLFFAFIMWSKRASNKQIGGFVLSMLIHIVATAIFDKYFTSIIDEIIYSIIFAMFLPMILYRLTKAPTLELLESSTFTTNG